MQTTWTQAQRLVPQPSPLHSWKVTNQTVKRTKVNWKRIFPSFPLPHFLLLLIAAEAKSKQLSKSGTLHSERSLSEQVMQYQAQKTTLTFHLSPEFQNTYSPPGSSSREGGMGMARYVLRCDLGPLEPPKAECFWSEGVGQQLFCTVTIIKLPLVLHHTNYCCVAQCALGCTSLLTLKKLIESMW